ncbi:MAG: general secretion pathway protein GspK [Phycisphaerales bacterium]|nr:general secretion pathway protein GspK [Phycisphaerales bacterium]
MTPRRGVILPVVLVLVGLLALTTAGFVFFIRAETMGTIAAGDVQQARLACESGFEEIIALLRKSRDDASQWFDAPERFRNVLVYSDSFDRSKDPFAEGRSRAEAFEEREALAPAWRYSAVGVNFLRGAETVRYGITPENSRLNLNTAGEEQLRNLLTPLLLQLGVENAPEIVDAILDWRDSDDEPRGGGAESAYYNTLVPPYNAKNGPFSTVEELLLVKGVNAAMLYGEDVNRNGILDGNENDGDASFPPYDNNDGVLNHGIAPFLTVWSREPDTAPDNKPRINLNADAAAVMAQIAAQLPNGELSAASVQFIQQVKSQNIPLRSPADLFPGSGEGASDPQGGLNPPPGVPQLPPGLVPPPEGTKFDGNPPEEQPSEEEGIEKPPEKSRQRMQDRQVRTGTMDPAAQGTGEDDGKDGRGGSEADEGPPPPVLPEEPSVDMSGGAQDPRLMISPITREEMRYIMDRFSTRGGSGPAGIAGLVNINTAPVEVLSVLPGMTPEAAAALVSARAGLDGEMLATLAWPLIVETIDVDTYQRIAPHITVKSYQFHIEVLGYADHTQISRRMEWIVEMIGPLPQVRYQRDLTSLGPAWPVDDDTVVIRR